MVCVCDARGTERKTIKISLRGQDFISVEKGGFKMSMACGLSIR